MSFFSPRFENGPSSWDGGHRSLPSGEQAQVDPFDFGEEPRLVRRALELNRQLLYEAGSEVQFDRKAVEEKIDELLDRLLDQMRHLPTTSESE